MNNVENIASSYSPPFKVVVKYFVAGIMSFLLLNFLLLLNYDDVSGHHFQPKILSLTHIATLGWITMIIFGAMIQLVPVVLEVKLFSSKLAEIQFWIFVLGIAGLVYKFWHFNSFINFTIPAILLNLSMYIFIFNITITMMRVKQWNITGTYLASALFYLFITAVAGLLLAINLDTPYIKINHLQYLNLHAHVAFIGWVSMVVMGVTYKLIPMFLLSHNFKLFFAKIALVLVNVGLFGISIIMLYSQISKLYYLFVLMIGLGMLLFLIQVIIIFKNRIRKKFDVGIKFSLAAYIALGVITFLGIVISFIDYQNIFNITLIYGYLIIFGYLSMLIVGQMYKIVPFLVWYNKYSSKVGLEKVPMLKEMYNERTAHYGFYLMILSLILVTISLSLQLSQLLLLSFSLMFLSSLMFAGNMIKIFRS